MKLFVNFHILFLLTPFSLADYCFFIHNIDFIVRQPSYIKGKKSKRVYPSRSNEFGFRILHLDHGRIYPDTLSEMLMAGVDQKSIVND